MTSKEIKVELHKAVDNLPDQVTTQALEYLKSLINKDTDANLSKNLDKILKEDDGLLKRLAQ